MQEYEFALRFTLPTAEACSDELVERLGEAGCDDALIGIGHPGRIALEFAREANSASEAILSAIADVRRALPGAELVEVAPDLVGATEVAALAGCTRQNIRKLMVVAGAGAPAPVHEGSAAVWHLAPVLRWLTAEKRYRIEPALLEVSEAAMDVNAVLGVMRTGPETQERVRSLLR